MQSEERGSKYPAPEVESFLPVMRLEDCPPGQPVLIEVRGHDMVLLRPGESTEVVCLENRCPHAGANLAAGEFDGVRLVCPRHHWKFDVSTGACEGSPHVGVGRYETCVKDGMIHVRPDRVPYCSLFASPNGA